MIYTEATTLEWYARRVAYLERIIECGALFLLFFHPVLTISVATVLLVVEAVVPHKNR
jgi:hypothetical protein